MMIDTLVFPLQDVTEGLLTAIKAGDADTIRGLLDSGYLDEHVLETILVSSIVLLDRGFFWFLTAFFNSCMFTVLSKLKLKSLKRSWVNALGASVRFL